LSPIFFFGDYIKYFFQQFLIHSSIRIIKILLYSKMPKKNTNWNTPDYRRFEFNNYGLSVDPTYTGADPFGKPKSQHLNTKFKMARRIG